MITTNEMQIRSDFVFQNAIGIKELDFIVGDPQEADAAPLAIAVSVAKFNYASITAETIRKQAQDAATRIRANMAKTQATYLEIGRDLVSIKSQLAHGDFSKWIDAEFDMTIRTAQNMMNAAELVSEYEAISILPPTVIYKLAAKSTPVEIKTQVATQIKSGTIPSSNEIEQQIIQAKHAAHQLKQFIQQKKADERAQNDGELTWDDREKELRASAMDDLDINLERKQWELAKAKKELSILKKLKREEDYAQEQTIAFQREQEEREVNATRAVVFLQDHLGDDFAEFRSFISNLNDALMFEQALNAADL